MNCCSETIRFKNELERKFTVKLGYANAEIYKCVSPDWPWFSQYTSKSSTHSDTVTYNRGEWQVQTLLPVNRLNFLQHSY